MVSGSKLCKTREHLQTEGNRYAELVGSCLFLSTMGRRALFFAVGVLSRYMSCPVEEYMRAAKGVL